jgi:hypothetical protein
MPPTSCPPPSPSLCRPAYRRHRRLFRHSLHHHAVELDSATSMILRCAEISPLTSIASEGDKLPAATASMIAAELLRSFARLQDGVCVDIEVLSDGLSGARVMKADVKDAQGGMRISAASKLGLHEAISKETERYEREVVRLPAGTYAPLNRARSLAYSAVRARSTACLRATIVRCSTSCATLTRTLLSALGLCRRTKRHGPRTSWYISCNI